MERELHALLVATDLSPVSDIVVSQAAAIAAHTGAALHVLHVVHGPPAQAAHSVPAAVVRRAESRLHEQLVRCAPNVDIASREVRVGVPHARIVARRRETGADLLVMGPHGRGRRVRTRLLGTTADRVLREADVPCLIVRRKAALPWRNMGVPTDLSVPAGRALALALRWSPLFGNDGNGAPRVSLVHVGWTLDLESDAGLGERLEATLREQLGEGRGVDARTEILWSNDPADALTRWARRAGLDLLVVPTSGESGMRRALLGSTSSALARRAPCSVLLVPTRDAATAPHREPGLARVAIGADLSESSDRGVAWTTRHLAPDAEHVLVHAIDVMNPPSFLDHGAATHAELVEGVREIAERHMRELIARLHLRNPHIEVREGRASDVLSAVAREVDADVIVVGAHTHPRGIWSVLGTTAERLTRYDAIPVLLARDVPAGPPRRILAAVDHSPLAASVLAWADFLARRLGARIAVCHVLSPSFLGRASLVSGIEASRRLEDRYREQGEAWLRRKIAQWLKDSGDVDVVLPIGDARYEIVTTQSQNGFDLVIVGNRGEDAITRGLLGSVASAVLRGASCPVLVVRGDGLPEP